MCIEKHNFPLKLQLKIVIKKKLEAMDGFDLKQFFLHREQKTVNFKDNK